ncbi:hypothetical protein RF11_02641 [Thelohanellus kitauei]|uniref:Uncharacterized protein n=1 Tax=Thelohanellus kitauei TaxID=669202 RepID=A0A0C2MGG0_THEKT|nr:hypothetical protein RF11_02641 [Thelohanellus kitauei]
MNDTIEVYRTNNHGLGTIHSPEHQIMLKDPRNINQSKPYAIPHAMQPKVKEEIQRLCALESQEKARAPFQKTKNIIQEKKGSVLGGIYSDEPFSVISTDIVGSYESRNLVTECERSKFWIHTNHGMKIILNRKQSYPIKESPTHQEISHIYESQINKPKLFFHPQSDRKRNKRTYKLHDKGRLNESQKYVSHRGPPHHQTAVKLLLP